MRERVMQAERSNVELSTIIGKREENHQRELAPIKNEVIKFEKLMIIIVKKNKAKLCLKGSSACVREAVFSKGDT